MKKEINDLVKENEVRRKEEEHRLYPSYMEAREKQGAGLFNKLKNGLSNEQKEFIKKYLDFYKYNYIIESQKNIKNLDWVNYRNGCITAITDIHDVFDRAKQPVDTFNVLHWKMQSDVNKEKEETVENDPK